MFNKKAFLGVPILLVEARLKEMIGKDGGSFSIVKVPNCLGVSRIP